MIIAMAVAVTVTISTLLPVIFFNRRISKFSLLTTRKKSVFNSNYYFSK
jgi:hypothetical protein